MLTVSGSFGCGSRVVLREPALRMTGYGREWARSRFLASLGMTERTARARRGWSWAVAGSGGQALAHDGDGFGVLVDEDVIAVVAGGGFAGCAGAGEEVEDGVAGVGVDADDAF